MSKTLPNSNTKSPNWNINIKTEHFVLNNESISEFIEHVKLEKEQNPGVSISLQAYVKDKFYPDQHDIIVIPDLSGATIGEVIEHNPGALLEAFEKGNLKLDIDAKREGEINIDLSGVDFTGCKMDGAQFKCCNLSNAILRDCNLKDVLFFESNLSGADFRGADITSLKFEEVDLMAALDKASISLTPELESELSSYKNSRLYNNMQFSTSESMLYRYQEDNSKIEEKAEEAFYNMLDKQIESAKKEIEERKKAIADSYAQLSTYEAWVSGGQNWDRHKLLRDDNREKINEQEAKIAKLANYEFGDEERGKIRYVVDPSVIENLLIVNDGIKNKYDPAYRRGSEAEELQTPNIYIKLGRKDIEQYLAQDISSLNEFVKEKAVREGKELPASANIIADLSVSNKNTEKKEASRFGTEIDLSGLDFSGKDLRGTCFVGANMQDCKFVGADISNATFEGADLSRADFREVVAKNVNLQAAKIQSATIENAEFSNAYMPHVRIYNLERDQIAGNIKTEANLSISVSSFDKANLSNANIDGVNIVNSSFNEAEMSEISMIHAEIKKTNMIRANLDRAILDNAKIIESDLSQAFLNSASAQEAEFKKTLLKNIEAEKVNFTASKIDELSQLEGANLEKAVMKMVKAERVKFIKVNMQEADLQSAYLKEAVIKNIDMRFANLENAIADGIKAEKVDLSGANLTDIKAISADFTKAKLKGIKAHRANLSEAILTEANMRGAEMQEAILKEVKAKKADIRDANLAGANLEKADVTKARINDNTDMHWVKAEAVKGKLAHEDENGVKTNIPVDQKIEEDNKAHRKKSRKNRFYDQITDRIQDIRRGAGAGYEMAKYRGNRVRRGVKNYLRYKKIQNAVINLFEKITNFVNNTKTKIVNFITATKYAFRLKKRKAARVVHGKDRHKKPSAYAQPKKEDLHKKDTENEVKNNVYRESEKIGKKARNENKSMDGSKNTPKLASHRNNIGGHRR